MLFELCYGVNHKVYDDALIIRKEVFVEEQNISSEREIDGQDHKRYHIVGYNDQIPETTARFYLKDYNKFSTCLKLERFATRCQSRGQGFGRLLIFEIIQWAKDHQVQNIILSSQEQATPFYENIGFEFLSKESYLDAGIVHYDMILHLDSLSDNYHLE